MSRRSYYYKPVERSVEQNYMDEKITEEIEQIAEEFPRYGYRRITHTLKREGYIINHKKVLRIMREKGLLCNVKRRFVVTTDSDHAYPIYPNLVRGLQIVRLNQVWVADITYVRLPSCFVYLAAILDGYSRKTIGHQMSRHIDANLTLAALRMATSRREKIEGIIHHSDRGVQYASTDYVNELIRNKFQISMARKGNPYDNAMAESFMKTLKYEEVYLWEYETFEDARSRIKHFIEDVYNAKRLHSSLDYRPPNEFEELLLNGKMEMAHV
jgi:putative transposase